MNLIIAVIKWMIEINQKMKFGLMAQRYKDDISLKLYRINFQIRKQKKIYTGREKMILFLLCKSLIEGKFIKIDVINEEFLN